MTALLNNRATIHHADAIHLFQTTQPVSNHDHGFSGSQPLQQGENMLLGGGIQPFGGLIKQPEIAVVQ